MTSKRRHNGTVVSKKLPRDGTVVSKKLPRDGDETLQFYQKLCQYKDHTLTMMHEYFQDDLFYVLETMNLQLLLSELQTRKFPNAEKYKSLETDRRTLVRNILQDVFTLGRDAILALWVILHVLQKHCQFAGLPAVLDELSCRGDTLVEQILLDKDGHQLTPELKDIQNHHKKHIHEKAQKAIAHNPQGFSQGEERFPFCQCNVNFIIISTKHFRKNSQNELLETGKKIEPYLKIKRNKILRIFANKLFRWCQGFRSVPYMIMVSGVAGIGKTTLMQKIVYDWVKGDLYQTFSFVFYFKFRELNRLDEVSLETMILHQYPYLEEQLENILQDPKKLLFIFDGLDESNHKMDFTSRHLCSDPKQSEHCGQIVVSLVRKSLLNGCSVLMTSRPARMGSIDINIFQQMVEITGFFSKERRIYFENFFANPQLAEKALNYVKQNNTLYTFCYLPSYCWIICTVLSKSFQPTSSDQPASLLPKTVTQLFAIFVANILSNHSLHKSDAQKILRSIGRMAEHGVMNYKIIFDERDLVSFHVDNKSQLLSSFLMESEEPGTYSFLHLTVQEFLSALSHYVDYSPEKLQKSLKEAKSYSDGRGEIFLRFLCGLSDDSTRSVLTKYLDEQAAQASRDVITWLKDHIPEEEKLVKWVKNREHLVRKFYYLFETQNMALVKESLTSVLNVDLSNFCLSALDCTVLAFILEACTNIEELNLYRCSLDTEGLTKLAPALYHIQELSLVGNHLQHPSCRHLSSVIKNNRSLKILDLSDNHLFGPHFSNLTDALSSPDCRIEELRLGYNKLPDTSCIQLASVIRNNRSLKKLVLSNNRLYGPHFSDLMDALSRPDCRIEELHLGRNILPDKSCIQLASVIRNNQSLKKLDLSCTYLYGSHFSDLMAALSSPDCRIEELHLRDNKLPDTSCRHLAPVIRNNQSLKILDLSGNRLSGSHFNDLVTALSSPACRIEELQLRGNDLQDISCIQLASGISNNQSLKILVLSHNHLNGPPFSYLMAALSIPGSRIEVLRLASNGLQDVFCIQLPSVIRNNQSLKILDLSYNRLAGTHLSDLMLSLSGPDCRIEELRMEGNLLPEDAKEALRNLERVKQNMKLDC